MANYVKFQRGTPSAFTNLTNKDTDTLYFISETDQKVGKLYLGDILVAANVMPDGTSVINSLGELVDVNLAGVKSGQVLSYNGTEWVPMTLDSALTSSVMVGASSEAAGKSGLVPAPAQGDQNKFLRGDGNWVEIPEGSVDTSTLATKEELSAVDSKVSSNAEAITNLSTNNTLFSESLTWGTLSK